MKRLLSTLMGLMVLCTININAQKPFSYAWHPDDVKDWVPGNLENDVFNRSSVPLAERIAISEDFKANPNAHTEGKVCALINMNGNCSDTPSQGDVSFAVRNFTHWQYIDILVWWGGSAGEGIIIPPSAPVTDIAHKNGVLSYGTVFFPPGAFGGQASWMNQMLEEENGECPYAKKLAEIAKYYGFDGWFINREGPGDDSRAKWVKFADTFMKYADPHMGLQWYDCGTSMSGFEDLFVDGEGNKRFESYFLNYGSANNSNVESNKSTVEGWGVDPFVANYHGIEVGGGGINHGTEFRSVFRTDAHYGSLAVFCTQEVKEFDSDKPGTDYEKMAKYNQVAQRFWSNLSNDVTNTTDFNSNWPGFAAGIVSRSAINSKPFVTNFNHGNGKARYFEGNKLVDGDWYNRGMQDFLPSWVWWIEADNKTIEPSYTWEDAYTGAAALKIGGKVELAEKNTLRLFKTNLPIASGDKAKVVFKQNSTGAQAMKLALSFTDAPLTMVEFELPAVTNGWQTADVDLSAHASKTVASIGLVFDATSTVENYDMLIGEIGIYNAETSCGTVGNLTIQNELGIDEGDLRLYWDAASGDVHHYNIYTVRGGETKLVGQTRDNAFYVTKFARDGFSETEMQVKVEAVSTTNNVGGEATVLAEWPVAEKPTMWLKASNTLINAGETITLSARVGNYPNTIEWILPAGTTVISENADKTEVEVKWDNEGVFDVTCKASNEGGETTETVTGMVTVSASTNLENAALNKAIHSESGHISAHVSTYLIDGETSPGSLTNKWCVGGEKQHEVIVDLQSASKIYKYVIHDTGVKENADWNMKNYKIYVSNDLNDWELVVDEINRAENVKTDFAAGRVARYVKLVCYDNELDITLRIWEFEIFAYDPGYELTGNGSVAMDINEEEEVELDYSLNGAAKADNFAATVTTSNDVVSAEVLSVDEANSKIKVKISSGSEYGGSAVTVKLTNGEYFVTKEIKVKLVDPSNFNILTAGDVTVETFKDGEDTALKTYAIDKVIDGDNGTFIDFAYGSSGNTLWHGITAKFTDEYKLNQLNATFLKSNSYETKPDKVVIRSRNADSDTWVDVEEYTISEDMANVLPTEHILSNTCKAKQISVWFYYENGYDDECRVAEVAFMGGKATATAIGDNDAVQLAIGVVPNPIQDQAEVNLNLSKAGNVSVEIYNLLGMKEATVFDAYLGEGKHNIAFNQAVVSQMKAGVYLVLVKAGDVTKTIKVIKR